MLFILAASFKAGDSSKKKKKKKKMAECTAPAPPLPEHLHMKHSMTEDVAKPPAIVKTDNTDNTSRSPVSSKEPDAFLDSLWDVVFEPEWLKGMCSVYANTYLYAGLN